MNAEYAALTAHAAKRRGRLGRALFFVQQSAAAQKAKTQTKERPMQPERADLYFQQGSSDKVYHLQLQNVQEQWSVQAQWGRRGSALQSDVKVSGTTYEEAKRIYDRILREKTGKGYQVARASASGNEAIAVGLPATKERSGHTPELLTPIEEPEALLLAQNAAWWFQQK